MNISYNTYLFAVGLIMVMALTMVVHNMIIILPASAQVQSFPQGTTPSIQAQPASGVNDTITSTVSVSDLATGEIEASPEASPQQVGQMLQREIFTDQSLAPAEKQEASSVGNVLLREQVDMIEKLSQTTESLQPSQDQVIVVTETCTTELCFKAVTTRGDVEALASESEGDTGASASTSPPPQ
jgi:hypothetical protein